MKVFRFAKVPGPYSGVDDDGDVIATGKRNDVAEILKARAAASQAIGMSAKVEELDEQGRVLHTFPFYSDDPTPDRGDDEDDAARTRRRSSVPSPRARTETDVG